MRAGVGKAAIAFPPGFFPAEGFSRQLDPLHARVLLLKQGQGVVILSVEMTSLGQEEVEMLKTILQEETGLPSQACWVLATHTFSAPHILPDHALGDEQARESKRALQTALRDAARAAAREATGGLREAKLSLGQSTCGININRDIETPDGWWIGLGGQGPCDQTLTTLRVDDLAGQPIALLTHYPVQPSVLEGSLLQEGGKAVSGDLAGRLSLGLEALYTGAVAMFLLGAAGDQSPIRKAKAICQDQAGQWAQRDLGDEGLTILRELAEQMIEAAQRAICAMQTLPAEDLHLGMRTVRLPGKRMEANLRALHPTRKHEYTPDGAREINIELMRLGELALVGVQPELNCVTARQITQGSPWKHTLVLTMVNGGAKYLADEDSYDRMTYEAMNSPFAKGAAEILRDQALTLLNRAR